MKPNRRLLIDLMEKYELTITDVMTALNVSYQTVRCWRSKSGKDITDNNLRLLKAICK